VHDLQPPTSKNPRLTHGVDPKQAISHAHHDREREPGAQMGWNQHAWNAGDATLARRQTFRPRSVGASIALRSKRDAVTNKRIECSDLRWVVALPRAFCG
jgi:hypothetical protein